MRSNDNVGDAGNGLRRELGAPVRLELRCRRDEAGGRGRGYVEERGLRGTRWRWRERAVE